MAITGAEQAQVEKANASGKTPVVFVHGLWLLPSSWEPWVSAFEAAGYAPLTPGWPDDPETVEEARRDPKVFAGKSVAQVVDHFAEVIAALTKKPVLVGHSFGGLIVQILAGRGLSVATAAIDPAPFRGVLPLPIAALRTTMPVLSNPANRGRAVTLTFDQSATAGPTGWARRRRGSSTTATTSRRRAGRSSKRRSRT
jgi:non-heme chloroperoxidase